MSKESWVKVYFELNSDNWHGMATESMWAQPVTLSESNDRFVLKNSPFRFKGVSYLDVIKALPRAEGNGFNFVCVVSRSGHSTYRLLCDEDSPSFSAYWLRLERLGCSYEHGGKFRGKELYAVDVPRDTNIYEVYSILEEGERNNVWYFEEAHVGHNLSKKGNSTP